MKPLASAAVFGLLPIPPMSNTGCDRGEDRAWAARIANARRALRPLPVVERMATGDELAHLRAELAELGDERPA